MNKQANVLDQITSLIDEINAGSIKTASAKRASDGGGEAGGSGSAAKDPGGYEGPSTHPSAKADGGNHPAPVGARARENVQDVKNDIKGPNVEVASEVTSGGDYNQTQIGTKKAPTGEDPSVEDAYKGSKEDPGTSHPMNAEDVGEKYSSWSFTQLAKAACARMDDVLGRLANGETVKEAGKAAPTKTAGTETSVAAPTPTENAWTIDEASAAGYELAKMAAALGTTVQDQNFQKFAQAQQMIEYTIQNAYAKADKVGEYLYKRAAYAKQAEGANPTQADPMGGSMEGGGPAMGGDPTGGAAAMDPSMAAGGDPTGGMGGAGGDPAGGAGGDPTGGAGGGEDAVNELANALVEQGIPVDKLIAALQAASGGAGDAGAGGAPGGDEKTAGTKQELQALLKVAGDIKSHMASGRFRLSPPKGQKEAQDREEVASYFGYLKEVLNLK